MRDGTEVALKLCRATQRDTLNAQVEARILQSILSKNGPKHGLVQMLDNFLFRSFYVIVFECLGSNLYKHIKAPEFKGMKKEDLRSLAS